MKKKIIFINLVIMFILISMLFSSCITKDKEHLNNENTSISEVKPKDTIQLWYYIFTMGIYENEIESIVDKAKQFCDENNINLEVFRYDRDTMTEEDYILKRNIAIASGNAIVIDSLYNLRIIEKQHPDYTIIENYSNLLNVYKDRVCIPLGVTYEAISLDNKVIQYYGISTEKKLMTYSEYLELKQNLKEKGARFELNYREFEQLIEYYMYKNSFLYFNQDEDVLNDKNKFKEELKTIITGVCNDIIKYNDAYVWISNKNRDIYDKTSDLTFDAWTFNNVDDILSPASYKSVVSNSQYGQYQTDVTDKSLYINSNGFSNAPNIFLYKKITDERIYSLVNHLANEETFIMIQTNDINSNKEFVQRYAPVFKINKVKELLKLDDNLNYINSDSNYSSEIIDLVKLSYDIILKDEDRSKEIADAYFSNTEYSSKIRYFIMNTVKEIAQKLSGEDLSLKNYNPEDKQINEFIVKTINDFVTNWYIYNN